MVDLLRQRRLRWLGHVCRMEDGRIPKDLLFGQLATGSRPRGRPHLRFKDLCKRDLLDCGLNPAELQSHAADRASWRRATRECWHQAGQQTKDNKETRKEGSKTTEGHIHSSLWHLHMHNMWQGLPIKDWALQPPKAMQRPS